MKSRALLSLIFVTFAAPVAAIAANTMGDALIRAAADGDTAQVAALLDAGAPIDYQNEPRQETVLMNAADQRRVETVDLLLRRGAKPNLVNFVGRTALYWATRSYQLDIIENLLSHGADPNLADKMGNSPLTIVDQQDNVVTGLLLNSGANPNIMNADGWTPLMRAAWYDNRQSLHLLLAKGASINQVNPRGETAYVKAQQRAFFDEADYLVAHGAQKRPLVLGTDTYRDKRLTPAQRWALATTAILAQACGSSNEALSSAERTASAPEELRTELSRDWDINDRADLDYILRWLTDEGWRHSLRWTLLSNTWRLVFQSPILPAPLFSLATIAGGWPARVAALALSKTPEVKALAQRLPWPDHQFLALDICRYIWVVRIAFGAGLLTRQEAWDRILPAAQRLQHEFSSWEALGADYVDGRAWSDRRSSQPNPRFDTIYGLLSNRRDPNSPWTKNPWATTLALPAPHSSATPRP